MTAHKKLDYAGLKTVIANAKYYIRSKIRLTKEQKYRIRMREFFESHGSATATPAQLTAICDEWYMESRPEWFGWTKFYNPELSAVSEGEKGGDNYKMYCEPSTNTFRGRDDYAGNPLFIPTDCNWEMTDDGEPLITSIEGIPCLVPFERNNPNKFVGVLQMTGYHWWNTPNKSLSSYMYEGYSSTKVSTSDIASRISDSSVINIMPLAEAVINEDANVTGRTLLEEKEIEQSHTETQTEPRVITDTNSTTGLNKLAKDSNAGGGSVVITNRTTGQTVDYIPINFKFPNIDSIGSSAWKELVRNVFGFYETDQFEPISAATASNVWGNISQSQTSIRLLGGYASGAVARFPNAIKNPITGEIYSFTTIPYSAVDLYKDSNGYWYTYGIVDTFGDTYPIIGYNDSNLSHDFTVVGVTDTTTITVQDPPLTIAVRSWVCHSKYMSDLTSSNTMTSYSGSPTKAYVFSNNTEHTYANNTSTAHNQSSTYSGSTICDNAFLILMARLKYGSLTLDNILQGCCKYDLAYAAVAAESGVKRVIISAANAENILVGSTMLIGTSNDRDAATSYSVSGQNGYVVTGKVPVGDNVAIVFNDAPNTFSTSTSTRITSTIWRTGICDHVLGNDGCPYDCANGKNPAKLQGIEYMMGGYEIFSDVLIKLYQESSTWYYQPYIAMKVAHQSTAITSNYMASGIKVQQPSATGWVYTKYMEFKNGIYYCASTGGSETTYTRDGTLIIASPAANTYQWGAYDNLHAGSYFCGINFLFPDTIGTNSVNLARLSCNGNRGNYV